MNQDIDVPFDYDLEQMEKALEGETHVIPSDAKTIEQITAWFEEEFKRIGPE